MAKKYAIVRVDHHCPNRFEAIQNDFVCKTDKKGECHFRCSESRYGDTKEQMVRKVEQGIEIGMKKVFGKELDQSYYNRARENHLIIAKEIVEFLGVEDERKERHNNSRN